jgi:Hypoxia induced protein conserved region
MQDVLNYGSILAVAAVFIVLLFGLKTMLKGDSPNTSQKLMRWRVGLQFLAVCILMAVMYFKQG